MKIFRKKCSYCGRKIEKGKEVFKEVKVPEFNEPRQRPFCSEDHAEVYNYFIKGTPSRSMCPNCVK